MKAEVAALALGSNLGSKRKNIDRAIGDLATHVRVVARSSHYRTAPWGNKEQDWFVNACVLVETALAPGVLLDLCLDIERSLGRVREGKWGPRLIDIDVLTYGRFECVTPRLTLPHHHILQRAFVLVPLAEIAPDLVIAGMRVAEALAHIDIAGVERLDQSSGFDRSTSAQRHTSMHKGFGVQVTIASPSGADPVVQPMVVVARDERDAELIAAAAAGTGADAQTLRELSQDEVRSYDLDLQVHGHMKALPLLDL